MKSEHYKKILSGKALMLKAVLALLMAFGNQLNAQNSCATATPITAGLYTIDVIDGANITTTCTNVALAEWYSYTPTEDHTVTVTSDLMQNICRDTHFSVYTGTCSTLSCYTDDDDSGIIVCNTGNPQSWLSVKTFNALAGTTYYIAWDNRYQVTGFDFQLIEGPFVESPCATAIPVTAGITTVAAIDGTNISTPCSNAAFAEWYAYTPTQNYSVLVTSDLAANICKDTYVSIYSGTCASITCVASDDNSGLIACNTVNTNSNLAVKTFDAIAGTTYYIAWDNRWSAEGFDFQITETPIVIPVTYVSQSIPTINSSYNMCAADMNGDGLDDLAGVSSNNLRINYQGAGGTFTFMDFPILGTSMMPTWSLAAGDYNKDGFTDLLLGNGSGVTFWRSNDTGSAYNTITPGQYIFCQRTNFQDINQDGNLDAFSCHDVAPNCFYLNDGLGNMNYYQSSGSSLFGSIGGNYASLWVDYNNDGNSDLLISKCSGPPCELHRSNGDGTYTNVAPSVNLAFTPVDSWSSVAADFDNDGDMDILIGSNGSVRSRLFRNDLDATNSVEEPFTDITAGSGWDTDSTTNRDYIAYDFDNDGFVDVLGGGGKIMFNHGNGTFTRTNYTGIGVGAVADLNNDGFLDIQNGTNVRYAVPNDNHWFKLTLKGIQSNIQGIGARVEIYGAWGIQIRDIRSGEGFTYASTFNAHFGLGAATEIEKVIVRWPSGQVDTIFNPAIDTPTLLVEGTTLAIGSFVNNNGLSIYPNPANDVLNIKIGDNNPIKIAQVFDLSGRMVINTEVSTQSISVKTLQAGTYILLLKDASGKQYTEKFIKK